MGLGTILLIVLTLILVGVLQLGRALAVGDTVPVESSVSYW